MAAISAITSSKVNVGAAERWLSGAAGIAMALYGLQKGEMEGKALAVVGGVLAYRAVSGHCPMYAVTGVNTVGGTKAFSGGRGIIVEKSIAINKPVLEVYQFWRDFTNLPRFMRHLDAVTVLDDKRSQWKARAPLGMQVQWEAEIINEVAYDLIGWRSLEGADVPNAGSVHFKKAHGGLGTVLRVRLQYTPPAGKVGAAFAKLFGEEPGQQIQEDLRRLKQLLETGAISTTEGQPMGR